MLCRWYVQNVGIIGMPVFIAIPCSLVMPATVQTTVCHCAAAAPVMIGPITRVRYSEVERQQTVEWLSFMTGQAQLYLR